MEAAFWVSRRCTFVRQSSPQANVAELEGTARGLAVIYRGKKGVNVRIH